MQKLDFKLVVRYVIIFAMLAALAAIRVYTANH